MNPNPWLIAIAIVPVIVAAVFGTVLSPSMARAVLALARARARARAQRVKHVPVNGTYLYANGVPLTEEKFREAFAAMNADLDRLSPPAERSEREIKQQYAAVNRFSVLTGRSCMPTRSATTQTMRGPGAGRTTRMQLPACRGGQTGSCSHRPTSSPAGASNPAMRTRREARPQQ